ncbi:MAG: Sensory rhodopsin I transducer [Methanoregula sp. PtaU1.Bin051]|nr:MAG: Sensory rhodopsin I transducer [Methanoregula sp. PtaU1.Bin051]
MIHEVGLKFNNLKIGSKILIICLFLVIVPTVTLGVVAYINASSGLSDQLNLMLDTQISDVRKMTDNSYQLSKNKLDSDLRVLRLGFNEYGTPAIVDGKLVVGGTTINNNFDLVDQVEKTVGSKATIFQKIGDQAIRVSTNVIGADGKRAVGTPVSDAVYDAVMVKGQTFYGTADVVGKKYVTAYEPIKDKSGAIIGILFVGVPEDSVYGPLKTEVRTAKLGTNGYLYIMDSKGNLIVHPTLEGQSLADRDFVKTMIDTKDKYVTSNGRISYNFEGKDVVAYYTYFPATDWIIASRVDPADFSAPVDNLRNAIVIILIISIAAGCAVSILFGRSIARRMDGLVNIGKNVSIGDLTGAEQALGTGAVLSGAKDEIGDVASAFGDVVGTLRNFNGEMNAVSAAAVEGRLTFRGDEKKFKGDYASMIKGINETINALVGHLDAIPVPAFIVDKEFTILYINHAAAAMAGKAPDELVGSKCYDQFKTKQCQTAECASGRCMKSGSPVSAETQAMPKDRQYDISYTGVPIKDLKGTVIGSMEFFSDLTEIREAGRKAQKKVAEALAFISEQLNAVSGGTERATASIEEVSAGAAQVAKNTGSVSNNTEKATQGVQQVLKAMEDMGAAVEEVTSNMEKVSDEAKQANEASKSGAELADGVEKGMAEISISTGSVYDIVKEIEKQMADITDIVVLIRNLANQTNLLALNAAIEAARAGDAGRGFAVVASEVKSLAEESRASAEKIEHMIADLNMATKNAAAATESSKEQVNKGAQMSRQALEAFQTIRDAVAKVSAAASEVAAAAEEQAATTEEITASIHQVDTLIADTAKEATDAAAASEESSAAIDQITKIVAQVNEIVENVKKEIRDFRY